jgi:hypothetical protein
MGHRIRSQATGIHLVELMLHFTSNTLFFPAAR